MLQLNYIKARTLEWHDVPAPALVSEKAALVADVIAVPWAEHMLCPLPDSVDPIAASGLSDNITDAWRAVGPPLRARPGARVLIAGGGGPGSIGLLAAGIAAVIDAREIVYLDRDEGRRSIAARDFRARVIDTSQGFPEDDLDRDFDVIVDASGNPDALQFVLSRSGPDAIVTSTAGAIYAFADVPFPVFSMYRNSVSFHTGWVNTRPIMQEPLELIRAGTFNPRLIETAVADFADAPQALAEPFTKLIFTREDAQRD